MFGFVNPPNENNAVTNVAAMMPSLMAANPDLAVQAMYVANKTMNTSAYTWGDNIDMADVPTELQVQHVQNVLMTRLMYAANPGMMEGGMGAVNPSGQPVVVPADISLMTAASDPSGSPTSAPAGVAQTASSSSSAAPTSSGKPSGGAKTGGAMGKGVASSTAIGLAVLVAFLAL